MSEHGNVPFDELWLDVLAGRVDADVTGQLLDDGQSADIEDALMLRRVIQLMLEEEKRDTLDSEDAALADRLREWQANYDPQGGQ